MCMQKLYYTEYNLFSGVSTEILYKEKVYENRNLEMISSFIFIKMIEN